MAEKDATVRLRRAVKENNLFLVKRLVKRTDQRNPDPGTRRYTSLAWAAVLGHEETFDFLLNNGHDDLELSRDSDNNYILMLLSDHKISPNSSENSDTQRVVLRMAQMYYDRFPKTIDWQNSHGKTALHFAAQRGNEELVRMLCDMDADYNLADSKGNTPLHYASSWGHIPVVQLLIERGCDYTARNNAKFTASDYAYSFTTRDTLQDTARLQYENNKKNRRAIFQQAAARGERGIAAPLHVPPVPDKDFDYHQATRLRSGSGTSRTTATSDSGEYENSLTLPPKSSHSSSSSPSQLSAGSTTHFHNGTSSYPQPPLLGQQSSGQGGSVAFASLASRMRERDADAREKYMRRNRSESQGTASTDTRSHSGSISSIAPSINGEDLLTWNGGGASTPRLLRPSASASQLRPLPDPNQVVQNSHIADVRTRSGSGTTPRSALPPTPVQGPARSSSMNQSGLSPRVVTPESENYTGPPSQYAQFPDPPYVSEEVRTPVANRRMALNPTPKSNPSIDSLTAPTNHRRGLSATIRGS